VQVRYRGAESGGGAQESGISAGGGVMVCEYCQDSLIDRLDRPALRILENRGDMLE